VVPGGEAWADRVETTVRSGATTTSPEVSGTVARLATTRFSSTRQRTAAARWLSVGYLALDDLTSARLELETALTEAPRDPDLLILAAIRAHRADEIAVAEAYLRRALEARPGDALAQLDLGIVLAGTPQRLAESRALLDAVAAREPSPLANRARQVLAQLR
jgi:Tfp pilus assembly protein PilF